MNNNRNNNQNNRNRNDNLNVEFGRFDDRNDDNNI